MKLEDLHFLFKEQLESHSDTLYYILENKQAGTTSIELSNRDLNSLLLFLDNTIPNGFDTNFKFPKFIIQ